MHGQSAARLIVHGPFRIERADGTRIDLRSRKGQALLAMLATSPSGDRTRAWLQDHLWGSRGREQAQGSLRNEILQINRLLQRHDLPPLIVTRDRVGLDRSRIRLEPASGTFLEGVDIAGEDQFEDWLREMRTGTAPVSPVTVPAPPASVEPPATTAIVVLPFANATGDPGSDYLAVGVADELQHRLSRLRWLMVITPGLRPAAAETDLEAGQRLGARYVLTGRLARHDPGFRLSPRLLDTATSQMVWAETFTVPAPQASDALNGIVDRMVALLDDRIDAAEQARAARLPASTLAVHDLIWRGRWHQNRLTLADIETAADYFDRARAEAPDSSLALVEFGQNLAYRLWIAREPAPTYQAIRRLAEQAIRLDPEDARAHMLVGIAEMWLRRVDLAETILMRAISLNPNLPMAHEQLATLFNLSGRPGAAIAPMHRSLALSPADFRLFYKHAELALSHLLLDAPDRALDHATQSITLRRGYWYAHVMRINALVRLGRGIEAAAALADLKDARPGFSPSHIDWIPFVDPALNRMLAEGLTRAKG